MAKSSSGPPEEPGPVAGRDAGSNSGPKSKSKSQLKPKPNSKPKPSSKAAAPEVEDAQAEAKGAQTLKGGAEPEAKTTQVLFYHLEHYPLERVLPTLVEKTLERGWRAVIQAPGTERLEALDALLWTFSEDSFVPHGTARDGEAADHPVYLTDATDTPNGARVRFLIDGADVEDLSGYERVVYMFDGHDPGAVTGARAQWKRAKDAGHDLAYWQQSSEGRWEKKA